MAYTSQSSGIVDHALLKTVWNAAADNGVVSGMGLSVTGSSLVVTIAAGIVRSAGVRISYTGGTVNITSAAGNSNPRMDAIIWDDSAGAPAVLTGTPTAESSSQTKPPLSDLADDNDFLLGVVYMAAGATVVASSGALYPRSVSVLGDHTSEKHKTATQVFTTDTTLATVTASSGNMQFSIAALETVLARFIIPVSFGGTGGLKMDFTGPGSPTQVSVAVQYPAVLYDGTAYEVVPTGGIGATAFSSTFIARSSSGTNPGDIQGGLVLIDLLVVNGTTAGTVVLRAAQNSSNSTTTLGVGSVMQVFRGVEAAA